MATPLYDKITIRMDHSDGTSCEASITGSPLIADEHLYNFLVSAFGVLGYHPNCIDDMVRYYSEDDADG
jgi:hypothetical protein